MSAKNLDSKNRWRNRAVAFRVSEEENEQKEYTVEALKERVRELERELFHLEEFIGQKGFWEESQKYIDEYGGEPIPFEIK